MDRKEKPIDAEGVRLTLSLKLLFAAFVAVLTWTGYASWTVSTAVGEFRSELRQFHESAPAWWTVADQSRYAAFEQAELHRAGVHDFQAPDVFEITRNRVRATPNLMDR